MSRTWKIVVVVSLVLNLFLLGAIAGAVVVGARVFGERVAMRTGDRPMFPSMQSLPPERQQALRNLMRERAMVSLDDLRAARAARAHASELMRATPYDAKAVEAALAQARDADSRARARIDSTLAARLSEFAPEERAAISGMMDRSGRGGGRGEGRGGRGRFGPGGPDGGRGPGGPPPNAQP